MPPPQETKEAILMDATNVELKALLSGIVFALIKIDERKHTPAAAQQAIAGAVQLLEMSSTTLRSIAQQLSTSNAQDVPVNVSPAKFGEDFYQACRQIMIDRLSNKK